MREAEWLYSGDTSDDSFLERVAVIERGGLEHEGCGEQMKLKPCPFCGGDPVLHTDGVTAISCSKCRIVCSNSERGIGKLVGLWNTRQDTSREHSPSSDCWCEPEIESTDPDTGISVFVHRKMQ